MMKTEGQESAERAGMWGRDGGRDGVPALVEIDAMAQPYESMEELESAHAALLDAECASEGKGESASSDCGSAIPPAQMGEFLARAVATGRILSEPIRRREAQALIDLWAAKLGSLAAISSMQGRSARPWRQSSGEGSEKGSEKVGAWRRGADVGLVLAAYRESDARMQWESAEARINAMDADKQRQVNAVLCSLVRLAPDERRLTLATLSVDEVATRVPEARDQRLIDELVELGVVRRVRGEGSGEMLRLSSDALLQSWPRMEQIRGLRRGLRSTTRYWLRLDRHAAALISEEPLRQAKAWADLSEEERAFVAASEQQVAQARRELEEREQAFNFGQEARRRAEAARARAEGMQVRLVVAVLVLGAVAALALRWYTVRAQERNREDALREQAAQHLAEKTAAVEAVKAQEVAARKSFVESFEQRLQREAMERDQQRKTLEVSLNSLRGSNQTLQSEYNESLRQLRQLEQSLRQARVDEALKGRLDELGERNTVLEFEVAVLRERARDAETKADDATSKLKLKSDELSSSAADRQRLESQLAEANNRFEQVSTELKEMLRASASLRTAMEGTFLDSKNKDRFGLIRDEVRDMLKLPAGGLRVLPFEPQRDEVKREPK